MWNRDFALPEQPGSDLEERAADGSYKFDINCGLSKWIQILPNKVPEDRQSCVPPSLRLDHCEGSVIFPRIFGQVFGLCPGQLGDEMRCHCEEKTCLFSVAG
jgi:hypothetical protein